MPKIQGAEASRSKRAPNTFKTTTDKSYMRLIELRIERDKVTETRKVDGRTQMQGKVYGKAPLV
jgi:hypothetical protein